MAWWNLHSSRVQTVSVLWDVVFFSIVMEGLDFITLYVALSQGQVDSILGGGVAMPQESSQRFSATQSWFCWVGAPLRSWWWRWWSTCTHTQGLYSLHTSSVCHRVPPEEHWRSTGSDKANRVQMERWNSASGGHEWRESFYTKSPTMNESCRKERWSKFEVQPRKLLFLKSGWSIPHLEADEKEWKKSLGMLQKEHSTDVFVCTCLQIAFWDPQWFHVISYTSGCMWFKQGFLLP